MQIKPVFKIKKIKIFIDIVMYIALILLMCEHSLVGLTHEVLGIILFLLFIVHNMLNFRWYKLILKRKINPKMIPSLIINFLILATLIILILSSFMISGYVFKGLISSNTMLARGLHMTSSIWLYILVSIHLGLHLNVMINNIKGKLYFIILETIIILSGLIVLIFIDKMYEEMFYLTSFKNYREVMLPIDFIKKFSVSLSISLISFNLRNMKRRKK